MPLNLTDVREVDPYAYNLDFDQINASVTDPLALCEQINPGGEYRGGYYSALNPTRNDTHVGSFMYDLRSNWWNDYANGDVHRGMISYCQYCLQISWREAAEYVQKAIGITSTCSGKARYVPRVEESEDRYLEWKSVAPPQRPFQLTWKHITGMWTYRDFYGATLNHVVRFDPPKRRKYFCPFTYCNKGIVSLWIPCDKLPSSLYNLHKLNGYTGMVVVTEGEKAADAVMKLLPGVVAVTSRGGSNKAHKCDWSPLFGYNILLWPDHDTSGWDYMESVKQLIPNPESIRIVDFSQFYNIPPKWDAADCLAEKRNIMSIGLF